MAVLSDGQLLKSVIKLLITVYNMNKIKEWLLNLCLKYLFYGIIEKELIDFNTLSKEKKREIVSDAKVIKNLLLWDMLLGEMVQLSKQMMFEKANTIDDLRFGKAVLYVTSVMSKKIDKLSSLK